MSYEGIDVDTRGRIILAVLNHSNVEYLGHLALPLMKICGLLPSNPHHALTTFPPP